MPTENERKYVLRLDSKLPNGAKSDIRQGYLSDNARLRKKIRMYIDITYTFTFKMMGVVGTGGQGYRLVELEQDISKEDFDSLWPKTDRQLFKTRNVVYRGPYCWEIDTFYHNDEPVFVMAEVELPEGVEAPEEIPNFISDNLLYEVPLGDPRFFNSAMTDMEKLIALREELELL